MATDKSLTIDCATEGDVLRVTPRGEIDLSTSPSLRRSLQAALAEGTLPVEIVLSEVPYMDSSGVATLVEALQTCRRQQRTLTLVSPSHRVASIFKISKLDTVFTIRDSDA
ncbi:MAG: STAS domain-containing protein [Phycisphaerales bacterium]|jgi:anti-sigma B factor antagonist|nr:STAS domain-containing protein [Phycisphaerales bacterium]